MLATWAFSMFKGEKKTLNPIDRQEPVRLNLMRPFNGNQHRANGSTFPLTRQAAGSRSTPQKNDQKPRKVIAVPCTRWIEFIAAKIQPNRRIRSGQRHKQKRNYNPLWGYDAFVCVCVWFWGLSCDWANGICNSWASPARSRRGREYTPDTIVRGAPQSREIDQSTSIQINEQCHQTNGDYPLWEIHKLHRTQL